MRDAAVCINSQSFSVTESVLYAGRSLITSSFQPHRHDFIEIEFITAGCGAQIINGIKYPLAKGSLCVMFPWHIHEISASEHEPLELFKCHFPIEFLLDETNSYSGFKGLIPQSNIYPPVIHLDGAIYEKIFVLFGDIIEEYKDVQDYREEMIRAKVSEIILYFDRRRKSLRSETDWDTKNESLWKIIEFIHRSYDGDITLRQLSEKFNIEAPALNQLFREYTGLNFDELLLEVRIRNACALLAYPHISISRIAENVGFKSLETFHRSFAQMKGVSPNKYRKTHFNFKEYNLENNSTFNFMLNARVIYYIHMHYSEDITLESMAQDFYFNKNYISELLGKSGASFTRLLHEIRIYHACSLLLTTDMQINDIGFQVGFNSTETFFRVFKKQHGISPKEYRKSGKV